MFFDVFHTQGRGPTTLKRLEKLQKTKEMSSFRQCAKRHIKPQTYEKLNKTNEI